MIKQFLVLQIISILIFQFSFANDVLDFSRIKDGKETRLLTEYSFKSELNEVLVPGLPARVSGTTGSLSCSHWHKFN